MLPEEKGGRSPLKMISALCEGLVALGSLPPNREGGRGRREVNRVHSSVHCYSA